MSASKEKPAPQNRAYTVDDIAAIPGNGISISKCLHPTGQIINMSQSCITPGTGAIEYNNLISII